MWTFSQPAQHKNSWTYFEPHLLSVLTCRHGETLWQILKLSMPICWEEWEKCNLENKKKD